MSLDHIGRSNPFDTLRRVQVRRRRRGRGDAVDRRRDELYEGNDELGGNLLASVEYKCETRRHGTSEMFFFEREREGGKEERTAGAPRSK